MNVVEPVAGPFAVDSCSHFPHLFLPLGLHFPSCYWMHLTGGVQALSLPSG